MLNPHRLAILRTVLAAGSINQAAHNLNYSPATISQHMAALANETGLVLFEKRGRGIKATDAAQHLVDQAEPVLADLERLNRVVADLRAGQADHLAIACFASAAELWVPGLVRDVRQLRPNLTVETSLNEPLDGRGRRRPDLDIRTEPVGEIETQLEGYWRHELLVEDLVAVLPATHRLAHRTEIELRALEAETWIDHDIYDSPIGQIVLSACRTAGFTPRYAARFDDHRAALRLVATGVGVTMLPRLAVADLPRALTTVRVILPAVRRRVVVHARSDHRHNNLITRAVECLRRSANEAAAVD